GVVNGETNCHHDGLHAFATWGIGAKVQNLYAYNNLFAGPTGPFLQSDFFLEGGDGPGSTPWSDATGTAYIWNNVMYRDGINENGFLTISKGTGHQVFNNTLIGPSANDGICVTIGGGATNVAFEDNAVTGCDVLLYVSDGTIASLDHNAYANGGAGG